MSDLDPALTDVMRERVAPGIWIDGNGQVHFSVPELLAMVDLPDTPANRAQCAEMVKAHLRREGAKMIIERPETR